MLDLIGLDWFGLDWMAASAHGGQEGLAAAYEGVEGDCSATAQALKHNPGIAVEWSADDQAVLEEGLSL